MSDSFSTPSCTPPPPRQPVAITDEEIERLALIRMMHSPSPESESLPSSGTAASDSTDPNLFDLGDGLNDTLATTSSTLRDELSVARRSALHKKLTPYQRNSVEQFFKVLIHYSLFPLTSLII